MNRAGGEWFSGGQAVPRHDGRSWGCSSRVQTRAEHAGVVRSKAHSSSKAQKLP